MDRLKQFYDKIKDNLKVPNSKDDNVLIIDGTNTFMRVFSAVPALNDDGMHVGGVIGFLKSVGSNIRNFNATRCIVVFDGRGGSVRRRKLYPEYKATRKTKTSLNRFKEFENLVDEQESLKKQFIRIIDYLDILPITVISVDNIEADDVVAYITKQYYRNYDNKVTIVSTDRDFLQLINDNISVYSPIKKILYTPKILQDELGILPENYLLYRMVSGDTSDNIGGVNGVGIKSLLKYFPLNSEKLSINDILDKTKKILSEGKSYKVLEKLLESRDVLERNYKLMQLSETDIPASDKLRISSMMDADINQLDLLEFRKMFATDKMYSNIPDVTNWINNTYNGLKIYAGT